MHHTILISTHFTSLSNEIVLITVKSPLDEHPWDF
jgi:hypothetical protein